MTDEKSATPPLTEGIVKDSSLDLARHAASIFAGWLLSRLLKRGWVSSEEYALLLGFLPTLLYNVGHAIWRRYKNRRSVATALKMPEGSTVEQLKAVLSSDAPTEILAATPSSVTVVKEVEKPG